MKSIHNKCPEVFYLTETSEGAPVICSNGGFVSLEVASRIMEACQSHLFLFQNQSEIDDSNAAWQKRIKEDHLKSAQAPKTRQENKRRELAFVYLMLNRRTGRVKIGISAKPEAREKTLQEEIPELELIHQGQGNWYQEQELHIHFASKRIRGEWFDLSAEEIEEAKAMIDSLTP